LRVFFDIVGGADEWLLIRFITPVEKFPSSQPIAPNFVDDVYAKKNFMVDDLHPNLAAVCL